MFMNASLRLKKLAINNKYDPIVKIEIGATPDITLNDETLISKL